MSVPLGSLVRKIPGDHLEEGPLVNTDIFAAGAIDATIPLQGVIHPGDPAPVAAEDLPLAYLVIPPELCFTRAASDGQHFSSGQMVLQGRSNSEGSENLWIRTLRLRGNSRLIIGLRILASSPSPTTSSCSV